MEIITYPFVKKPAFLGVLDRNLKKIEDRLGLSLSLRGDSLYLDGDPIKVENAKAYFEKIRAIEEKGYDLKESDFHILLDLVEEDRTKPLEHYYPTEPLTLSRKSVAPKSLNQKEYIDAIRRHDVVFGIGPAGTGKTYLAMAMALSFYMNKQVSRIVLTRPAVEAGERLGFLPGDMLQKVNPYLRPLYDALFDLVQADQAQRLIEKNILEIAPLAYMRGRTLSSAFIILDEAQNTTREQMKMLLTRAGYDSKVVITADITQIDLPQPNKSGVIHAMKVLAPVKEIAFCKFTDKDVVRHPLVQKIIKAYEKADARASE
jgi:phosphate starvation-inducible protein PhoH and related proteins